MKLGVSYIIFDDLELVEDSLTSLRPHVDFITLGYSFYSWIGTPTEMDVVRFCQHMIDKGLADDMHYGGDFLRSQSDKFNNGLARVRELTDCTHFLLMPNDEFFVPEQFEWAKNYLSENKYDASVISQRHYWKDEKTYIYKRGAWLKRSFIFDITDPAKRFIDSNVRSNWPAVDSRTKMQVRRIKLFTENEIMVHHLSHVRKDIRRKWGIRGNVDTQAKVVSKVYDYMNTKWQPGMPAWINGHTKPYPVSAVVLDDPVVQIPNFYQFDRDEWLATEPHPVPPNPKFNPTYANGGTPPPRDHPNVRRLKARKRIRR